MKTKSIFVFLFCNILLFASSLLAENKLPPGTIQAGTLANQKLIKDALQGINASAAINGCSTPEQFIPYVVQMPTGNPGSRVWRELWVSTGCKENVSIPVRFAEDGMNAAVWSIEEKKG